MVVALALHLLLLPPELLLRRTHRVGERHAAAAAAAAAAATTAAAAAAALHGCQLLEQLEQRRRARRGPPLPGRRLQHAGRRTQVATPHAPVKHRPQRLVGALGQAHARLARLSGRAGAAAREQPHVCCRVVLGAGEAAAPRLVPRPVKRLAQLGELLLPQVAQRTAQQRAPQLEPHGSVAHLVGGLVRGVGARATNVLHLSHLEQEQADVECV